MPECSLPLLGQDLPCQVNAQLTFSEDFGQLHIPPENAWRAQICLLTEKNATEEGDIPDEVLGTVIPIAWSSGTPGRAKNVTPVKTELKPGAQPVRKKQYPIKLEVWKGLEPTINSFLEHGQLREWQSEFNTPIWPVKKLHSREYRLVQDLQEVNVGTTGCTFIVLNPYTLLASIPGSNTYFTVLNLKDAFFWIPVDEQSQTIFAFEWQNPTAGQKMQLCWTVLPQGFKNSPTFFANALAKPLEWIPCLGLLAENSSVSRGGQNTRGDVWQDTWAATGHAPETYMKKSFQGTTEEESGAAPQEIQPPLGKVKTLQSWPARTTTTYRECTRLQQSSNSLGGLFAGVWGSYLQNPMLSRRCQNIPKLPGRTPKELLVFDRLSHGKKLLG